MMKWTTRGERTMLGDGMWSLLSVDVSHIHISQRASHWHLDREGLDRLWFIQYKGISLLKSEGNSSRLQGWTLKMLCSVQEAITKGQAQYGAIIWGTRSHQIPGARKQKGGWQGLGKEEVGTDLLCRVLALQGQRALEMGAGWWWWETMCMNSTPTY